MANAVRDYKLFVIRDIYLNMEIKICTKCGEEKSLDSFSPRENGKFASHCKTCKAVRRKSLYKKVKRHIPKEKVCTVCLEKKQISEFYKNSNCSTYRSDCKKCVAKRAASRREEVRSLIISLKSEPCSDCGIPYPYYVMDFDHKTDDKDFNISEMRFHSKDAVLREVAKCDLVCSNCHRIRTHERMLIKLAATISKDNCGIA